MAKLNSSIQIVYSGTIKLSEVEIRALDALVGYGDDQFIKVFGDKLGKSYLEKHERGLRSFFETVRSEAMPVMRDIDAIRKRIVEETTP